MGRVSCGAGQAENEGEARKALARSVAVVATFTCLTGWRILSEVLPLRWRQVDSRTAEARLDPGATNDRHAWGSPRRRNQIAAA